MIEGFVAKAGVEFLNKHFDALFGKVKTLYKSVSDEVRISWRLSYETYLNSVSARYFYAKPFLSSNKPTPLYDFYAPLGVSCGETIVSETSIDDLMLTNKFAVIMANAGSGKSMLMRHLFLDAIKKTDQVPIFVELRDLNNYDLTLFELIKKKLLDNKFDLDDEYIEKAFKAGHFAIFLDGFDEVSHDKREEIIQAIQELADKYDKNYFMLSSRPDDSLYKWTLFNVWEVQPLTVDLACLLVKKTVEDEKLKAKFIKDLQENLFKTHESFLSNPLLLSIMLITYKDSASIPQKLSTFYDRAYVALFERHDAQKGAFRREKRSKLDIQVFRKVFSSFCFLTYSKRKFSFSETDIYEYLENTQKLSGVPFNKKDYLEDLIQAVCLLIRDGLEITFSHRSFQEYFTALYVTQINNPVRQKRFIEKYYKDQVLEDLQTLLYEISPELVEKYYIIPIIQELERTIDYNGYIENPLYTKFLTTLICEITLHTVDSEGSISIGINNMPLMEGYAFVITHCLFLLNRNHDFFDVSHELSNRIRSISKPDAFRRIEVSVSEIIQDENLLQLIAKGNNWLSQSALADVLKIKNLLIEKHKQQEAFLDEELLS